MAIRQKEGQRGDKSFPQNKEEVANVRKNVVKMMHVEGVQDRISKLLPLPPQKAFPGLAQLVAQVIAKTVGAVKGKHGAKVHIKLIMMLTKLAVSEINLIAKALGYGPIPKPAAAQIAMAAGKMLDEILSNKQGQPQQGPQQPMGTPPNQMGSGQVPGNQPAQAAEGTPVENGLLGG